MYAMTTKSYDRDMRNIAKISPKIIKKKFAHFGLILAIWKRQFLDFSIFSKTVHTIQF